MPCQPIPLTSTLILSFILSLDLPSGPLHNTTPKPCVIIVIIATLSLARCDVLTAALMRIQIFFLYITPCRPINNYQRFGGSCCLSLQGLTGGAVDVPCPSTYRAVINGFSFRLTFSVTWGANLFVLFQISKSLCFIYWLLLIWIMDLFNVTPCSLVERPLSAVFIIDTLVSL